MPPALNEMNLTKAQIKALREAEAIAVVGIHRRGRPIWERLCKAGLLRHVGVDTVEITQAGRDALANL